MKKYQFLSLMLVLIIILSGCAHTDLSEDICTAHKDSDDNGICDICNLSVLMYIDFYAINDLHGKFDDTSSVEGVDGLTTLLKNMSASDDHVVFLSSGDMWQGSSESNLTKGAMITEWMNHLGFVSMTLGNHEYDWGEEYIEINAEIAEFPFLAINIYDKETNKRVEYCDASVVVERGGIEIGIIGAIGDCYSSISGDKSEDIYFKTGNELTELVKTEAERLRSQGVDIIVYSIHDGYEDNENSAVTVSDNEIRAYYNTTLSNGYIDLVFEGHTHQKYTLIDKYGVYHMQGGGDNKGISHVEMKHNYITGTSGVSYSGQISSSSYANLNADPVVESLMDKYSEEIAPAYAILGNNSHKRYSDEIKNLVAELYYKVGEERWAADYDIVLGGGFISARSPYNVPAGEVRYSDLYSVLPFDNQIVLCSVEGRDLISKFLETTNPNYYIYLGEYGQSVHQSIDPNKIYYIITDKYSSSYEYNRLTVIEEYDPDVFARDLIAEYIKNGGWKK